MNAVQINAGGHGMDDNSQNGTVDGLAADLALLKNPAKAAPLNAKADQVANDEAMTGSTSKAAKTTKAKTRTVKASGGVFNSKADGVYFVPDEGEPRKICGALSIVAQVRNKDGMGWSVLVKLTDLDGVEKEHLIPRSKLQSDQSSKVMEELADAGLWFSYARDTKPLLMQYLQSGADAPRARLIPYTGWHDGAFVLPDAVIGCANEALIYSGKLRPPVEEVGTLEGWRDGVAKYAVGNPLLALTLGAGFAGALLRLSGMDSGGFHIAGDSKAGKSTVCDMAASIYGQPKDYRQTWHGTATGIEYTSAAFNDLPLVLDEIGQGDPKAVDTVVYMLSQGKGKARGRDSGGLREATRWCCFLLSNGEHDLATYLQMGGKEIKAGQAVRLLSLQARRQFGAFDELHGFSDAPALCAHIATQAQANHGTAGRAFLARLADADHAKLAQQVREYAAAFAAVTEPQGASPQVRHASQYFALASFAGILATEYGLTGWPDNLAMSAAQTMFTDWLHHRGGMGNEEDRQILQQVRYFFEQHGMARFARWDDEENAVLDTHSAKTLAMCGYRKTTEINTYGDTHGVKASEVVFYVTPESWRNDVLKGLDSSRANKLLLEMGILQPDTSGKASRLIRLPAFGKNPIRCYVLNQAALYAGAEID